MIERRSLQIDENSPERGQRIDRIVQSLCGKSRKEVFGLFDHRCVLVSGAICSHPGQLAAAGDKIELAYDPHRRYHPLPRPAKHPGFDVLFEDGDLIVVNKPAALLSVPTPRGETTTLLDKVSQYVQHSLRGKARRAFPCHRLDRGVSGVLVFAKSAEIAQQIRDQFALHKPERKYQAIVAGRLEKTKGTFESLLATDKNLNRFTTEDEEIGQLAITHYAVVCQLADATVVEVWLETGRRNQIRVHFAEAGHPVLGDPRYRPDEAQHRHWPYKRLALHAERLGLIHPHTKERLQLQSPLPAEFNRFFAAARRS